MAQDRFTPVYASDWDVRVRAIERFLAEMAPLPASVASAIQTGDLSTLMPTSSTSSFPSPLVFDTLGDVTITSPAAGDLPVFDGAGWVNQQWTPGKLGIGTAAAPTVRLEMTDGNFTSWFDGQTSNPKSGSRGWHLNKQDKTVALPHTWAFAVGGVFCWDIGMDFDTNNSLNGGTGNADFVVAYDRSAGKNDAGTGAGDGADIFRFSPAEASVAGDNYGRVGLGFRQGTPNTVGSAWFTVTGPPDVVGLNVSTNSTFSFGYKMVQRGAHNRTMLNHNDKFAIGCDHAAANARTYQIRDLVAATERLYIDASGNVTLAGGNTLAGSLAVLQAPTATANYGMNSLGDGGFAGSAGHFVGGAGGTYHAINAASSFTSAIADWQINGKSLFSVNYQGQSSLIFRDAGTVNAPGAFRLQHRSTAGAVAGFGAIMQFYGQDNAGTPADAIIGSVGGVLTDTTAGTFSGYIKVSAVASGSESERMRLHGDGRAGVATGGSPLATGVLWNLTKTASATPSIITYLQVKGVADTALTASTEASDVIFDFARTAQFGTGALTNQRALKVLAPSYGFVGASTITNAATVYISDAPVAGTNATITNAYSLWCDAGLARFDGNGTHVLELPQDNTDPTSGGGAATGRIPVLIGGTLRYLAYW